MDAGTSVLNFPNTWRDPEDGSVGIDDVVTVIGGVESAVGRIVDEHVRVPNLARRKPQLQVLR